MVSNQSTGYCPDLDSSQSVAAALDPARHPPSRRLHPPGHIPRLRRMRADQCRTRRSARVRGVRRRPARGLEHRPGVRTRSGVNGRSRGHLMPHSAGPVECRAVRSVALAAVLRCCTTPLPRGTGSPTRPRQVQVAIVLCLTEALTVSIGCVRSVVGGAIGPHHRGRASAVGCVPLRRAGGSRTWRADEVGSDPDSWGSDRCVWGEVISRLLFGAQERRPGYVARIDLAGARITGKIDLSGGQIEHELRLARCWIDEPVGLLHASSPSVTIVDSCFPGLDAPGWRVSGLVSFEWSRCEGEIILYGAHITDQLVLDGASIINPDKIALLAEGLTVNGGMFFFVKTPLPMAKSALLAQPSAANLAFSARD